MLLEAVAELKAINAPVTLFLFGIAIYILTLASDFKKEIAMTKTLKRWAIFVSVLLVVIGLGLFFIPFPPPENMGVPHVKESTDSALKTDRTR